MFVGLGLDPPLHDIQIFLSGVDHESARGVVLLSHKRPLPEDGTFADRLHRFVGSRELLILHGHDHPPSFPGSKWDPSGLLVGKPYVRSHVCSSVTTRRGFGHFIEWRDESFHCSEVPAKPVLWEGPSVMHDRFGKGLLLKREGYGDAAILTVSFPAYGEKRVRANHRSVKLED
jgi:hypothetical protein